MVKKILGTYNDFSIVNARIKAACVLSIVCLLLIGTVIGAKSFLIAFPIIICLLICCVIITKSYIEKKVYSECSKLIKDCGTKMNGTVIESNKEINWGGPNSHIFRYTAAVACKEKTFLAGYFEHNQVKKLINKNVDVYVLGDYVYIDMSQRTDLF